ncbi:hypothetical protein GQ55_2G452700 [Panicum hallii var. hallii]|uniref:GDSL esterase/lipase n=1 Tax=Panicum hallii var. hallii TaxID=1504633 RepID=A0A2T7EZA1_9POAL|nr:hypothetical protein GQ55_2G452700 [Panicum hallii var. hallii]
MATAASRVLVAVQVLVAACAVLGGGGEMRRRGHGGGCFTRLFSFGDSITDNGNWMHYTRSPGAVARPPYGETFFRRPNGRFCDGRIIIDHIADALGIPFLTPYLAGNASEDYAHGANFAVGGATALGHDYFRGKKLDARFTPYSLHWQMRWLKKVLRMLSPEQGPAWSDLMASSLFLVGEIGGNDYNQALFQGRSVDEVKTYVPDVVAGISASVTELIGLGAKTVVVPGNFPIGCNPGYLAKFQTKNTAQYDSMGCLRWPNDLTKLHNRELRVELAELGRRHPSVAVVYADYYAAAMDLTADPRKHGFGGEPLVSCCGGGGPYNTNLTVHCGMRTATTCRDPYAAVSWDGFHLTDHAYKVIADGVLRGPHAAPPILARCGPRGGP